MPQTLTLGLENIDPRTYMLKGGAYSTGDITYPETDYNEIGDERYLIPLKSNVKLKSIHLTSTLNALLAVTFKMTLKVGRKANADEGSRNLRYGDPPTVVTLFSLQRLFNSPAYNNELIYTGDGKQYLYELCGYTTDPECLFYPLLTCDTPDAVISVTPDPVANLIFGVEL